MTSRSTKIAWLQPKLSNPPFHALTTTSAGVLSQAAHNRHYVAPSGTHKCRYVRLPVGARFRVINVNMVDNYICVRYI